MTIIMTQILMIWENWPKKTSGTEIAAKKLLKNTEMWQGKNDTEGVIRE